MIWTIIAAVAFISITVLVQWLFTNWMFNKEENK